MNDDHFKYVATHPKCQQGKHVVLPASHALRLHNLPEAPPAFLIHHQPAPIVNPNMLALPLRFTPLKTLECKTSPLSLSDTLFESLIAPLLGLKNQVYLPCVTLNFA